MKNDLKKLLEELNNPEKKRIIIEEQKKLKLGEESPKKLYEKKIKDKLKMNRPGLVELNRLGLELSTSVTQQIEESEVKDEKTMRCFYSEVRFKEGLLGLCWLQPNKDGSLVVYLRKKDYSSIDPENLVEYSTPQKKTFGEYPLIKVYNFSELDYVLKLIRWAYLQDKPNRD